MLQAMTAVPASPIAPSPLFAQRMDHARSAGESKKRRRHTAGRKSMSGLAASPFNYWNWYTQNYLPSYYSYNYQQVAQPCPAGYMRRTLSTYPFQTYCSPIQSPLAPYYSPYSQYGGSGYSPYGYYGYPYSYPAGGSNLPIGSDPYIYYRTPQDCVGRGGLWDSFSQSCQSASGSPSTVDPASPASQAPSVIGQYKYNAAAMLNAAGYEAWLVQEDGSYFNPPPGYDPRRIDLWVRNGVVERQATG